MPPDQGRLRDVGVARLLRAQTDRKRTGVLEFRCSNSLRYRVYFLEGDIVAADSDAQDLRLGSLLYRLNKISLEQLEEAIEGATGEQQLGEILVEKGFLTSKERQEALFAQFHETLTTVFLLEDADYEFTVQETIFAENLQLFHDTAALIEEGEKLLEGVSELTRDIEANNHVYEVLKADFVPGRREEEEILRYIDGRRTAAEIFQLSPFDRMTTVHLLRLLLTHGVIREAAPQEAEEPAQAQHEPEDTARPLAPTPTDQDAGAKTVVKVGRSGTDDVEAGLFFSSQSVLDRVDLSHVDNYRLPVEHEHHGVVETLDADDESAESEDTMDRAEEPDETATVIAKSSADIAAETHGGNLAIEMDSEGDGLSEIFEGPSEDFMAIQGSDEEALLHIATDDIEFQETQLDVPLPGPAHGTPREQEGVEPLMKPMIARDGDTPPLRHGFPEHPDVAAEVTIEEDMEEDEEYTEILAHHIEAIEAGDRKAPDMGPIDAILGDDVVSGQLPPLDLDQPLFSEPPVLSDLSDDEIVIENGLESEEDERPLMDTPAPLTGAARRAEGADGTVTREQQEILDRITSLFKKPGARAAFGGSPEPWLPTSTPGTLGSFPDSLQGKDDAWLLRHAERYNAIFSAIFAHFQKKLGRDQTRQIFESFFMPGNSSFPELFIDVAFSDDGKLDVRRMLRNVSAYGTNHPADVLDACLNEVFYFLIRDIHLVLNQDEQDSLMKTIMPTREQIFKARFAEA